MASDDDALNMDVAGVPGATDPGMAAPDEPYTMLKAPE